jgi:hypothetical protein
MKKQRKHYTSEDKVAILRRHLLEKEPISKLCATNSACSHGLLPLAEEFFEKGVCLRAKSHQPFR